ncbi:MAG: T9SS type A sorting domain-containing protein [Bacteroidetes bacterium]|nr:T9SS type A sorting domain-containing protein [Bacteroidota bacterium]
MKKIYVSILIMILSVPAFAQSCNGLRYRDFMFQDSSVTNVVYGSNVNLSNVTTSLKMDVWMPKADTGTNRPLIILMHGGNFLAGSKSGSDVLQFSKDFAKMGYVVASIDYRVGMTNFPLGTPDSVDATGSVIRAVHDGKAAVRYFKKDFVTNGNHFRIDTANIFFMGVSAGAITALHMAYMNTLSEFPVYADTVNHYGLHGGVEGLSGNPGYSSSFRGVIDICGALKDTSWIATGNMPAMLFHGNNDQTVPYGSAIIYLLSTYPLLMVDGTHSVEARLTHLGIEHCFNEYIGQDHVPEVGTSAAALAYYDTTLIKTRNFLVHYVCGDPLDCSYTTGVGVNNLSALPSVLAVYPNPAENNFSVNLERLAGSDFSLEIYDAQGKLIESRKNLGNEKVIISTENLPSGIYFIKVSDGENVYLLKEVVR